MGPRQPRFVSSFRSKRDRPGVGQRWRDAVQRCPRCSFPPAFWQPVSDPGRADQRCYRERQCLSRLVIFGWRSTAARSGDSYADSGVARTPETTVFTGTYMDAPVPAACGPKHSFQVGAGRLRIVVVASAAIPSNDIVLKLYFFNGVTDVLLVSGDTATSPETVTYEPPGGVPPGTYKVEVCPFTPPTAPAESPYNYAGTFTTDDSAIPGAGVPYPPKWKYFQSKPLLTYASTDVRLTGCWEASLNGVPVPGCDHRLLNLAARVSWDYEYRTNTFTSTTPGNAAQTAESWGSPLTPSTPYSPVSATREYIFPRANACSGS